MTLCNERAHAPAWQASQWGHRPSSSAPCAAPMRLSRIDQHIKDKPYAKQRALLGVFSSRSSSISRGVRSAPNMGQILYYIYYWKTLLRVGNIYSIKKYTHQKGSYLHGVFEFQMPISPSKMQFGTQFWVQIIASCQARRYRQESSPKLNYRWSDDWYSPNPPKRRGPTTCIRDRVLAKLLWWPK
jgi:hypothetical protein